jgi:hypothetical protein
MRQRDDCLGIAGLRIRSSDMRRCHHVALGEAMVDQALSRVRAHGADQVSIRGIATALAQLVGNT